MTCGIYYILNLTNGKRYVGESVNIQKRWKEWVGRLNQDKLHKHHDHLQNAWNKYGKDNFYFHIVEECPFEQLLNREAYYIRLWNTMNRNCGYNKIIHIGVKIVRSDEYREKCRQRMMGNTFWVGKHHTEEWVVNTKKRMMGNNYSLGLKFTEEHKNKIGESQIGKKVSDEAKIKMSKAKKGKKLSKEHVENIIKAQTGSKRSEKAKKRMAEANKETWRKRRLGLIPMPKFATEPFSEERKQKIRDAKTKNKKSQTNSLESIDIT